MPQTPTGNNDPNDDDESDPISRRLAEYRANFNPESIRKSSKASSTFDKHQSNHERLLVWLLDNKPEYLHDEFLQQLNDADAHVDYQVPSHSHTAYRRRGGNKSLEVRMREYRMKCLRVEAKTALGTPGMPPPHPTVRFELLEGDVDCFLNFISSIRKENGGLLKSGAYTAFRSSFTYLFHRYKYVPSRAFEKEMKEAVEGVKRFTNQAAQAGEGNLWDPLFTNPAILALKQHVAVAMPWESHYTYFKPASGLPPHVILYAYIKGLDVKLDGLPKMIEDLLDKRQMAGPLSLDQIARAVENGPVMRAMAADLASLRARSIQSTASPSANVNNATNARFMARLHRQYNHPDGKSRRVPPSWVK